MTRFLTPGAWRHALRGSLSALTVTAVIYATPSETLAQGLFSPAIMVNQDVVTYFELEQREQFLRLLRAPGDPVVEARKELIKDRLKKPAMEEAGIEVANEDIEAGMEEFAARAKLSKEEFIKALGAGGVEPETFRDFVEVGIGWREYIRARFLSRARPTDAEIDRAIGREGGGGGLRILLSEIIIPVTPQTLESVEAEAERISKIGSTEGFAAEAARFSASETRDNGGRMEWLPINDLPPALRPLILALSPGEITAPIALPNAIALFQMRDIQETGAPNPSYATIEYAVYYIAGGRSPEALAYADNVKNHIHTCNDLYGIAKDLPAEVLERRSQKPSEIPRDIALELAKLDQGEISTTLTSAGGQQLVFLMLCGRTATVNEDASREDIAVALTQQRLTTLADSYLAQLQADAVIIEK